MSEILSDRDLLLRLRQQDELAFVAIYQRYWKTMLLAAWNHTKDKSLSEDIVHEVFLKLWENREKQDIQDLAAFLATATKYRVFKYYRKQARRKEIVENEQLISDAYVDDEKEWDALFLAEYIQNVVQKMPKQCRLVFQYSRVDGLKNTEIASLLQISEKGVEANLTRALKTLRSQMRKDGIALLLITEIIKEYL